MIIFPISGKARLSYTGCALIILLAACNQGPTPAADTAAPSVDTAAATPSAGATDDSHGQAAVDCSAAGANCTEAERAQGHRAGMAMEREAHAQGMAAGAQAPMASPGMKMDDHMGMPMNDGKMPMPPAGPTMKRDAPMPDM